MELTRWEELVLALSGTRESGRQQLPGVVSSDWTGQAGDCHRPSPALCVSQEQYMHASVESSRQLLVTDHGRALTLGLSFHKGERKLHASSLQGSCGQSGSHGKGLAPVTP